jgi:DNA helicase-2/ATP-dependent DNA helicase PcrA
LQNQIVFADQKPKNLKPNASPSVPKIDLNRLNAEQRAAVLQTEGPVLILAGAGSGKTNTMTHRIAYLIAEKGVPASRILGLSFTNKASTELKDRVRKLVGKVAGPHATHGLVVSTFHSLCVRILREFAPRIGYTSQFSILDPSDQEGIVREILKLINIDSKKFDPAWVLFQIGQAKNKFLSGEDATIFFNGLKGPKVSYDDYSIALQSVFPKYQERLKLLNAMDFDDLIFNAVTLLENNPDVRDTLSIRYRYIMVDEYQDTNQAQFRLLKALLATHRNICVVGDDDQSIYAWRGADPEHILGFHQQFPDTKKIILNQNYRSTETILKAANQVIAKNPKRYPKSLWSNKGSGSPLHRVAVEDDRAEALMVVEEILKKSKERSEGSDGSFVPWRDFAILYRSNSQSRIFEESMRLHQVPYKLVGAMSFLDRKEVKDVLCYWKLVLNSKDDASLRRVINWPARGIGKTSITLIHEHSVKSGLSFFEAMQLPEIISQLNEKAQRGIGQFLQLRDDLERDLRAIERVQYGSNDEGFLTIISEWAKKSLTRVGAKLALQSEEEDLVKAQRRFESVEELASAIGMMEIAPYLADGAPQTAVQVLQDYLSQLILNSKDEKEDDDTPQNNVTVMTLHGAKGLEFPVVFLVGLEDGNLPHQRSIDEGTDLSEERRLFYVGITRAKEELYLIRAKNRIRYGKAVPRNPCRFLEDIPEDLILERDESSTPEFKSKEAEKRHEEEVATFFSEIQKRLKKT